MSRVVREGRGGWYRLDPVPGADELEDFYESRYYDLIRRGGRAPELRKLTAGGDAARRDLEWLRGSMYRDLVDSLVEVHGACSRVLDVGAGTGQFVEFLRAEGLDAEGIEPAREASESARAAGIPIHTSTLAGWSEDPNHSGAYDAVVALNVLEHVPDPVAVVRGVRKLLAVGGVAVIRVPNDFSELQEAAQRATGLEPWWICAPDHVNYFTFASLCAFLASEGLPVEHQFTDFPVELFLLMGDVYVGNVAAGAAMHERRVRMELALPPAVRRRLYTALAAAGFGRNAVAFGRRRD